MAGTIWSSSNWCQRTQCSLRDLKADWMSRASWLMCRRTAACRSIAIRRSPGLWGSRRGWSSVWRRYKGGRTRSNSHQIITIQDQPRKMEVEARLITHKGNLLWEQWPLKFLLIYISSRTFISHAKISLKVMYSFLLLRFFLSRIKLTQRNYMRLKG